MTKQIIAIFFAFALFSCTDNRTSRNVAVPKQDTLLPPKVTILAALPDSLQPKTILLETMPTPRTIVVPTRKGGSYTVTNAKGEVTKISLEPPANRSLPVLLNEKGEPIRDSAGNTFVMGEGGVSHFTTFTTDNGLALDAISCSILDKAGNLWFGTDGGGVSRYDGRSFTTFSTAQGLANNNVRCITEDKAGNLWFGTYGGGVSRFDGRFFTTFSAAQGLANDNVRCIVEDKAGNLWFGTDGGGVSRYGPAAKTGTGPSFFTTFSTADGLANNNVRCIAEDRKGNLWFGTYGGGVSCYGLSASLGKGSRSFTTFSTAKGLTNNQVLSIFEDKAGNLWFGTYGGGVSRYGPATKSGTGPSFFTTFSTAHGLANNYVRSIAEDKAGNLWFGTYGGGISRYTPAADNGVGSRPFSTFSIEQGLANNVVYSITEDKMGNLWFGTDGGGVSRYDGGSFTTFSTAQGLANNTVYSIFEDKERNVWFGTAGGGVSRYGRAAKSGGRGLSNFTTFSTGQGLAHNTVWSIVQDKTGNLWFGSYGRGVSRYGAAAESGVGASAFTTFSTAQGLANNVVYSICEDKAGNLWFGTDGGVSRYTPSAKSIPRPSSFVTFSTAHGLANDQVYSICEDRTGNLWFGTAGGVSRYDGKSLTTFSTTQGLADDLVLSIAEDKSGNLWFGTAGGLSVIGASDAQDLALSPSPSTAESANTTAAGQRPSASRRPGEAIFKTFTTKDGLPDNFVSQVLQMPDGKMAVGTNLGITMCRPSADLNELTALELYNSNTEYPVKDVNTGQNCMLLDSKGIIWAGTGSEKTALVRFDPSAVLRSKEPPTLVIKGVKINEAAICWNDLNATERDGKAASNTMPAYITEEVMTLGRALSEQERDSVRRSFGSIRFDSIRRFYPVPDGLVLPYALNHVTIDFNAIETGKPKLVNYQYKLEGYDKDWNPVSKNNTSTFGNIREGNYTFKVKAQSPDGVWCAPVTYTFIVLPPWYRTWWAYGSYFLFLILALRLFTKWRERKLTIEKAKLERTVDERTAIVEQQKEELVQKNSVVEKEKQRSEELLLNILPGEVAEELKANGTAAAKLYDNVTVLFTDFVGFSTASERMTPQELVNELHACFQAFDGIVGKYNIEKIKTVGDAYLAVCGLPQPAANHAENVIRAALEIRDFMVDRYAALGSKTFQIRIGVHSGSLVAGIVGVKKFAYDVWGDTVNTAARMEQNSEPGKINISAATYELVRVQFNCQYRGEIAAKNKGMLKMYFVGEG